MKKYWYCEGVDESWMTAEGDEGWQKTVEQYAAKYARHPGGPYYLASEVDEMLAKLQASNDWNAQALKHANQDISRLERELRDANEELKWRRVSDE